MANWNLTLSLNEARKTGEVIALADNQILRFIDEINEIDSDAKNKRIKSLLNTKPKTAKIYAELDAYQFQLNYICIVMDSKKDYLRANQGFTVNGIEYRRLLGTNGGVKSQTIVYINKQLYPEIRRRLDNGRNLNMAIVPDKFEAYQALVCSASTPVTTPDRILVVDDCITHFKDRVIYLDDENDGDPKMEEYSDFDIELNATDGFGLISPTLSKQWAEDLGVDYLPSGYNTRFAFEKGMVFTFDFHEFGKRIAQKSIVKDVWGNDVDVNNVDLILTSSMVKLWDSYESCEHYYSESLKHNYRFAVSKICPEILDNERYLNYQFLQSYELTDDEIYELVKPTVDEYKDVLGGDYRKSILFLNGVADSLKGYDFGKALMVDPEMINDPFISTKINEMLNKRINAAKTGAVKVHGNYSIISGDPYLFCEHVFALPERGLLKAGELYNKYWLDENVERVACFRAPMTCHNNIRVMNLPEDIAKMSYWYQYMTTCTILNGWDTTTMALNGADFDSDMCLTTNNSILLNNTKDLPAIMCVQRKAKKKKIKESDLIKSNINNFGDDIGKTTNWITSMFTVRAKFGEHTKEYGELSYRIMCGQLYQQNAVDRAKGVIAKLMPKRWYNIKACDNQFDKHICADKKPYFMTYIYPNEMKKYNKYISKNKKNARQLFNLDIDSIKEKDNKTTEEKDFLYNYDILMPLYDEKCVINRVCKIVENEFDSGRNVTPKSDFNYSIIKSDSKYNKIEFKNIKTLYSDYIIQVQDIEMQLKKDNGRKSSTEIRDEMKKDFRTKCLNQIPDVEKLTNIVIDICLENNKNKSMQFAWDICGKQIIKNLLDKNNWNMIYPVENANNGDVIYAGKKYSFKNIRLDSEEYNY